MGPEQLTLSQLEKKQVLMNDRLYRAHNNTLIQRQDWVRVGVATGWAFVIQVCEYFYNVPVTMYRIIEWKKAGPCSY